MNIYIGFSAPTGPFEPFAWLIKKVEARDYSHCYIRFQEPTGSWMIFQASGLAVNIFNLGLWLSAEQSIKEYEIAITDAQSKQLWGMIKQSVGLPYSLKEDFGILLMKIFKMHSNPFSSGGASDFCSQLAAKVCRLVGISIPECTSTIDPSLLDKILSEQNLPVVQFPDLSKLEA